MKIYIAGPYSSNPEKNMKIAEEIGVQILKRGHIPFIPHKHTFGWEKRNDVTYEDFLRLDFAWLECCDALFFIGRSLGADRELEHSKKLNIPVYYKIDDIPKDTEER